MEREFSDLIILLANGINQRRMYFDDHPKVRAASSDFVTRLSGLIAKSGEEEFVFGVFGGKFIRQGKYLVGPSIAGRSLIEFAERLGCGGFVFRLPLAPEDMSVFYRLGAAQRERLASLEEGKAMFEAEGIGHIELSTSFKEEGGEDGSDSISDSSGTSEFMTSDFAPLLNVYQALYDAVSGSQLSVSRDEAVNMDMARSSGESLVQATDTGAMDVKTIDS